MLKYLLKRKVIRPNLLWHVSCVLAPGSQLSEGSKQLRLCVTGDVAVLDSRDNWPWPETQLSGGEMKAEFETSCMYWNTAKVRCIFRCSNISSGNMSALSLNQFIFQIYCTLMPHLLSDLWVLLLWIIRNLSVLLYWYHKL